MITYTMTVGGLPATNAATDFDVYATGTLSGLMATGTGDFITGFEGGGCEPPEARLSFDIDFDDGTLATYSGTINFDFTLDANCGSSICFASASVAGGPCP
jgi:hypothetical protein